MQESKFIIMYGPGGCWSGYTNAKLIDANSKDEAMAEAFLYASIEHPAGGLSCDAVEVQSDVVFNEDSAQRLCGGRLKSIALDNISMSTGGGSVIEFSDSTITS